MHIKCASFPFQYQEGVFRIGREVTGVGFRNFQLCAIHTSTFHSFRTSRSCSRGAVVTPGKHFHNLTTSEHRRNMHVTCASQNFSHETTLQNNWTRSLKQDTAHFLETRHCHVRDLSEATPNTLLRSLVSAQNDYYPRFAYVQHPLYLLLPLQTSGRRQ